MNPYYKAIVAVCITVILCGILFWPTLYHYDHIVVGGNSFPVRINRITGYTEDYLAGKWVSQEQQKEELLPPEEQAKVTGNASFNMHSFNGEIYNGSNSWTITSAIIQVTAYQPFEMEDLGPTKPPKYTPAKEKWNRLFKTYVTPISPLSTGHFNVSVESEQYDTATWQIKEIRGYREKTP